MIPPVATNDMSELSDIKKPKVIHELLHRLNLSSCLLSEELAAKIEFHVCEVDGLTLGDVAFSPLPSSLIKKDEAEKRHK